MLIERIRFKDFMLFKGEQEMCFRFLGDGNRNATVVIADTGKTTIVEALRYLLGEDLAHPQELIPNLSTVSGAEPGTVHESYVEATVRDGDRRVTLRRGFQWERDAQTLRLRRVREIGALVHHEREGDLCESLPRLLEVSPTLVPIETRDFVFWHHGVRAETFTTRQVESFLNWEGFSQRCSPESQTEMRTRLQDKFASLSGELVRDHPRVRVDPSTLLLHVDRDAASWGLERSHFFAYLIALAHVREEIIEKILRLSGNPRPGRLCLVLDSPFGGFEDRIVGRIAHLVSAALPQVIIIETDRGWERIQSSLMGNLTDAYVLELFERPGYHSPETSSFMFGDKPIVYRRTGTGQSKVEVQTLL